MSMSKLNKHLRQFVQRSDSESCSDSDVSLDDSPRSPVFPPTTNVVSKSASRKRASERSDALSSRCVLTSGSTSQRSGPESTSRKSSSRTPLREKQPHVSPSTPASTRTYSDEESNEHAKRTRVDKENELSEWAATNRLILSVIKRLDRQEKKLSSMEQKLDQKTTSASSSSCSSTPRRRHNDVPLEVRKETRRTYNMLCESEDFNGWKIERGYTYKSRENQSVLDKLVKEVKGHNANFSTQHIRDAAYRFYRSKCEEDSIRRRGKTAEIMKQKRMHERLSRKLTERKAALTKMEFSTPEDQALWEKVMVCAMMSSEESAVEDEEEILFVHPLSWRSAKVDTFFATLDQTAKENKSPQALRQMKKRVIGTESMRDKPVGADFPRWAVRQ